MKNNKEKLTQVVREIVAQKEKDFYSINDTRIENLHNLNYEIFCSFSDGDFGKSFKVDLKVMNAKTLSYLKLSQKIRNKVIQRMTKIFTPQQLMCMTHALENCYDNNVYGHKQVIHDHIDNYGLAFYDLGDIKHFKDKISRINRIEFDILMDILIENTDYHFKYHIEALFMSVEEVV